MQCASVCAENKQNYPNEWQVGKVVSKNFIGFGTFSGTVKFYAPKTDNYKIVYSDGDDEVLSYEAMKSIIASRQR